MADWKRGDRLVWAAAGWTQTNRCPNGSILNSALNDSFNVSILTLIWLIRLVVFPKQLLSVRMTLSLKKKTYHNYWECTIRSGRNVLLLKRHICLALSFEYRRMGLILRCFRRVKYSFFGLNAKVESIRDWYIVRGALSIRRIPHRKRSHETSVESRFVDIETI